MQEAIKTAWTEGQRSKSLKKVEIIVKANSIRVKHAKSKLVEDYPIFLVSYCGASSDVDTMFFFIRKPVPKVDKLLLAEIFQLSDASKVTAITLSVAKAFNIAFKAWMAEKRKRERDQKAEQNRVGSESPRVQRRQIAPKTKEPSHLVKIAPGVSKTSGPYTPPVTRKVEETEMRPKRSGSFGDTPDGAVQNPAIRRLRTKNEVTGSTHDVTITGDFDDEFEQLAETSSHPDLLDTNLPGNPNPDDFNIADITKHADLIDLSDD